MGIHVEVSKESAGGLDRVEVDKRMARSEVNN
jgi:hypothetical protein